MEENSKPTNTQDSSDEVDLDKLAESIYFEGFNYPSNSENTIEPEKPKFEGYKTNTLFFHFLCVFGVVFLSILFVFQVYLSPITVVGQSMLPTINAKTTSDDDKTHCDIVYYRAKDGYDYGDIVIISNEAGQYIDNSLHKDNPVNFLIKRIIACPGDTITFYRTNNINNLYYYSVNVKDENGNQVEISEDYILEDMVLDNNYTYLGGLNNISEAIFDDSKGYYEIKLTQNQYFAMGDNRNNSSDSRYFGAVNIDDICGNVRIHVKYGENIWIAIFNKLKSYLSVINIKLKENL